MKLLAHGILITILLGIWPALAGPQSLAQLDVIDQHWSLAPNGLSLVDGLNQGRQALAGPIDRAYQAQTRAELRQALDEALVIMTQRQGDYLGLEPSLQQLSQRLLALAEAIDVPLELIDAAEHAHIQARIAHERLRLLESLIQQLRALEEPRLIISQLERLLLLHRAFEYGYLGEQGVLGANNEFVLASDPIGGGLDSLLAMISELRPTYERAMADRELRQQLAPRFSR